MSHNRFPSIIGHERVCELFERMLDSDRLAHAFLFLGQEGSGRTAFLTALAAGLTEGDIHAHADVQWISRLTDEKTGKQKTQISVGQIRDMRERLGMSSMTGGKKIAVITEAETLSPAAANALLKTLEEPQGDALIMLRAHSIEDVPRTISSRCQVIRFHAVAKETITKALQERGLSKVEASQYAALSLGRPGLAIRMIEDGAYRAEQEIASSRFASMRSASLAERFGLIQGQLPKEEVNKAAALELQLDAYERSLRDALLASIGCESLCLEPAPALSTNRCEEGLRAIRSVRRAMKSNINPQLALEHIALTF